MKTDRLYTFLTIVVLVLTVVPVGTAVFVLGFLQGDSPCVMCWEQRVGMAIIALIGLFVIRYGPRPKYIGAAVLVGAWGVFMGLRHTGMHASRDVGQGFSVEILGAHTYTWSLFIFWVCVVTMGALLLALREDDPPAGIRTLRPLEKHAMVVFLVVIAGNMVQAFASTGPPPFMGQGDPIRFSFNPKHWVWSLEEWSPSTVSLRGRWAIEKPDLSSISSDADAGPFATLPALAVEMRRKLSLPLLGTVTDISYDPGTDHFLLTTQNGVYIADGALSRVLTYTIVDPGYSVDLGKFAGAAFLDDETVMALGENKSYVILREQDGADADKNFKYFLESFDAFGELARSRLTTVRARMMYVMALAYDPASNSLYTVTVPNTKVRRMVVSRFDRADMTLSEEFMPAVKPGAGPALRNEKRSLDELYITGAGISDGRMYAISAAFGTLLTIDLATHQVIGAHRIEGLVRPTGLAIREGMLYIPCDNGEVSMVRLPLPEL